jgi:hypothetical protein
MSSVQKGVGVSLRSIGVFTKLGIHFSTLPQGLLDISSTTAAQIIKI